MQGDYPADQGFRPRRICHHERVEPRSGRLFLCAACRAQVIICSHCDGGQIYCNGGCGARARRRTVRGAGRRYQASLRGRRAHAARQGRYRARRQNVTHHGSPAPARGALLPTPMMPTVATTAPADAPRPPDFSCHWCGRRCLPLLRPGFRRRRYHRRAEDRVRNGINLRIIVAIRRAHSARSVHKRSSVPRRGMSRRMLK